MLVLSRKKNEDIVIGEGRQKVTVRVVEIIGDRVKLGFIAPNDLSIMRTEIIQLKAVKEEPQEDGLERSASGGPLCPV